MRARAARGAMVAAAAGFVALALCGGGQAQEVARASDPIAALASATWAGPYAGVEASAGGDFGRLRLSPFRFSGQAVPGFISTFNQGRDDTPWAAGGFAGYQLQAGNVVFGAEVGGGRASLKRTVASDQALGALPPGVDPVDLLGVKRNWEVGARARLGYAFDDFLIYATLGVKEADLRGRVLVPGGEGRSREVVGPTFGFGADLAISEQYSLGIDYRRSEFGSRTLPLGTGLPEIALPRARLSADDVVARLTWHPEGLRLTSREEAKEDEGAEKLWSVHGQTTFIQQATPKFRSPYVGPNSFLPSQARETWTVTGYLGRRLWEGAELYFNPEVDQGFGLSRTLGIAGYVNGEAQKAGASYPKYRSQRYFLRQVFGLGGETESVEDGPNQIAGIRDVDRVTVTVGKFAVGDYFDDNKYAHDPRLNFNNWSLWASSAFDFPANLPGFTQGAVVELNRKDWALRAGLFQVPKIPASDVLDPRIDQKYGSVVEFEHRHELFGQPGKWRLGAFTNVGRSASFRQVDGIVAADPTLDINDVTAATRRDRRKSGVYSNVEQALADDVGIFARASWADGRNEVLSFTDIDRSLSGGFSFKGLSWDRPKDAIGIGAAINGLSPAHQRFFALGGLGLLVGDGRLDRYRPEKAFETYYAINLASDVTLTLDYQLVANPGYNPARGPAHVFGTRLHAEF